MSEERFVGRIVEKVIKEGKTKTGAPYKLAVFKLRNKEGKEMKFTTFDKDIRDAYLKGDLVEAVYEKKGMYNTLIGFDDVSEDSQNYQAFQSEANKFKITREKQALMLTAYAKDVVCELIRQHREKEGDDDKMSLNLLFHEAVLAVLSAYETINMKLKKEKEEINGRENENEKRGREEEQEAPKDVTQNYQI